MNSSIRFIKFAFLLAACFAFSAAAAHADLKIKSRNTTRGQSYESTTYIKGKRQRSEMSQGFITIQQCDLKRDIQIMPQTKMYKIDTYDAATDSTIPAGTKTQTTSVPATKGGVVTMTTTLKDTGERKQMFGYTARRILTTVVYESSPDACSPMKMKMEQDGWYIDFNFDFSCPAKNDYYMSRYNGGKGGCQDKYNQKQIGTAKKGYAVWEKMTMYDENGKETTSFINEVVEISSATLDAALFEVPADYTEVKDFSQAYASTASNSGAKNTAVSSQNEEENDVNVPATSSIASNVGSLAKNGVDLPTKVGEKKPGVVRIGLVTVKTEKVGEGLNAQDLAAAVGNTLAGYLKAENIELVNIEARLAGQIEAEGKQKDCDFLVYTTVSHKKGGGGFGMFGKIAGQVLTSAVPYGNAGAAIAGQVAATAILTAASMSSNVKSKDQITLDVKLQAPTSMTPAMEKKLSGKAKSDGEDVISPLAEQAAQAILAAAKK